jgi:hypothetical protein
MTSAGGEIRTVYNSVLLDSKTLEVAPLLTHEYVDCCQTTGYRRNRCAMLILMSSDDTSSPPHLLYVRTADVALSHGPFCLVQLCISNLRS